MAAATLSAALLVRVGNVSVVKSSLSMTVVGRKLEQMLLKDSTVYVDGHRAVVSKAIHGDSGGMGADVATRARTATTALCGWRTARATN